MSDLKRDIVKYIRDASKNKYPKKVLCAICSTTEQLELHHYNTLSLLLARDLKGKPAVDSVDKVMAYRDDFINVYSKEIFIDVVCLCKNCHNNKLHKVYGKVPALSTACKQPDWVEKMRTKHNALA